jgi:hypothetical protein
MNCAAALTSRRSRGTARARRIAGFHGGMQSLRLLGGVSRGKRCRWNLALLVMAGGCEVVHNSAWSSSYQRFSGGRRCYLMTGDSDYLLRVVVPNVQALEKFILNGLTKINSVANIRSSFSLKQVKYDTALPLAQADQSAPRGGRVTRNGLSLPVRDKFNRRKL